MEIGLVSCSKKKRKQKSKPKKLYDKSPLFNKKKLFCKLFHQDWYILSAKHKLLNPDGSKILPYDESLKNKNKKEKKIWSSKVFEKLRKFELLQQKIIIHAGKDYYKYLLPHLEKHNVKYEIPANGLRFGEKLSWYKKNNERAKITDKNFYSGKETGKIIN